MDEPTPERRASCCDLRHGGEELVSMMLADRADRLPGGGVLSAMDAEVERTLRAALAATPSGRSYWLFAGDGGISAFGDAEFLGDRRWATASAPTVAFAAVAAG